MKVTRNDVLAAIREYVRVWGVMGVELEVEYQEGQPSAGQAHRLFVNKNQAAPGVGDRGYIGWTKAEACETLWTIVRTLCDLSKAQQGE